MSNSAAGTGLSSGYRSGTSTQSGTLKRPTASANTTGTHAAVKKPKVQRAAASAGVFKLSDQLRDKLKGLSKQEEVVIPASENVEKLQMKDDRKETKKKERRATAAAAGICAGMMGIGAFWEEISFRLKLRGRKRRKRRVTA